MAKRWDYPTQAIQKPRISPSNFTYGPPSAPPGGSPCAGLSCPHEPTAPQPRSAHPRSPGPRRPLPRYLPIPLPAPASRRRARPPAATHRPRGAPRRLRPGLPAELLRETGTRRAAPPPCAHQKQTGKFGRPLPSLTPTPGAAYLYAEAPGRPPDPPALPAARRGRQPAPHADPGSASGRLSPGPQRRPPACGIRRIQAPPGRRGAAALQFLSGSSPPGAGSQLHRRVKIFFFSC